MDSNEQTTLSPNGSWKTNHTHKQYYENTGLTPRFMMMLRKSILEQYQESTFLPEDSPAKTSATLERELALRGVVLHSGSITCEPLMKYDPSTQSLKTLVPSQGEDSMLSLVTLPRSGMMRNGIVYQLPPLVRLTVATESSSWPTPTVADTFTDKLESSQIKEGSRHSMTLGKAVKMWPTPQSSDYIQKKTSQSWKEKGAENFSLGNPEVLERVGRMWPTPTAGMWKHTGEKEPERKYTDSTARGVAKADPEAWKSGGGQLNPTWVEWLMGFPIGWTELSVSEMPSSRCGRKQLGKPSKKQSGE